MISTHLRTSHMLYTQPSRLPVPVGGNRLRHTTPHHTTPHLGAMGLLQCTATLPRGSRQWNSCNALPHCLGAVGSEALEGTSMLPGDRSQWNCYKCSTAHCPQAVWQCIAVVSVPPAFRQCCSLYIVGLPLPTAPRQCGSALRQFRCPLPPAVWRCMTRVPCPLGPGSVARRCRSSLPTSPGSVAVHWCSSSAHTPLGGVAVHCIAPLPTAPKHCGDALQEFHCLKPLRSAAVHCSSSTAHCPRAVMQCIAAVPLPPSSVAVHYSSSLPTAPRQCGGALPEVPAHCPQAVWQCIAGVPLPAAPG